jgi:hypothetical protein
MSVHEYIFDRTKAGIQHLRELANQEEGLSDSPLLSRLRDAAQDRLGNQEVKERINLQGAQLDGVELNPDLEPTARGITTRWQEGTFEGAEFARAGERIYITRADASPYDQARVMLPDLKQEGGVESTRGLYRNKELVGQVIDAYESSIAAGDQAAINAMAAVIEDQVDRGKYISNHLLGDAFDVSYHNLPRQGQLSFLDCADNHPDVKNAIDEGDHAHVAVAS